MERSFVPHDAVSPLVAAAHLGTAAVDEAGALALIERLAAEARRRHAALLILPQRMFMRSEPSDGAVPQALAMIARRASLAVLCGYTESCSGRVHDAGLLIGGDGTALANYRRAHVAAGEDGLAPGNWLTLMPVAQRRVGLSLGLDLHYPEAARALALAGIDLLAVQTAADPQALPLAQARAIENGLTVAVASRGEAGGGAALIAPDGSILDRAHHGLALAAVPHRTPIVGRRPRLYARLVEPDAEAG